MYFMLKHAHITLVAISVGFFVSRFIARQMMLPWVQARWVKIAPHIIDTLLLLSAAGLCLLVHQYPFVDSWLTEKLVLLVGYIGFALMAMKAVHPVKRWGGFFLALACIGLILHVAISKQPILL